VDNAAVDEERVAAVRELLRQLEVVEKWDEVVDDDVPEPLAALQRALVDAFRRADVEWLLEHADPAIEIVQPLELPGALTYRGRAGLLDALLDWPSEWRDFEVEPLRVVAAGGDALALQTINRGRSHHADVAVEAEIAWLMRWAGQRLVRWDMFLSLDDALAAARRPVTGRRRVTDR
jgi:ketosteroid isomerase-like protein